MLIKQAVLPNVLPVVYGSTSRQKFDLNIYLIVNEL